VSAAPSNVIGIGSRSGYTPDFHGIAADRLKAARESLGEDRVTFAATLTGLLGWPVTETALARWEKGVIPPADVLLAAEAAAKGVLIAPPGTLLGLVPQSFPATALEGPWVTSYRFTHAGQLCHHADIAVVTAESDRHLRAVSLTGRTEGRAVPFANEIEAQLASRHWTGWWKNTSDARYFGQVHLAVLPGETVMDGYYTGFASDIAVSCARWRWVRLGADHPEDGVTLAEPAAIHELVMNRSEYDGPLTLADIGGNA
jgi:hypothetical protein